MHIAMIDVDGNRFPNLALMKLSAWHKQQGDEVEWWNGLKHYDVVYKSKIFDGLYTADMEFCIQADRIVEGGTGYGLDNRLPDEIEHTYPDYDLYSIWDTAYGFLTRGCPRQCSFCLVSRKEGTFSHQVSELSEFYHGQREIVLLDPNLLACPEAERLLQALTESRARVDLTQGLDIRLTDRDTIHLLNRISFSRIRFAWDDPREDLTDAFKQFARHTRVRDPAKRVVYVLTNYGSNQEEDLYRIYTLRDLGFSPYVMIYDKPNAPQSVRELQRWCNNRYIFHAEPDFTRYRRSNHQKETTEPDLERREDHEPLSDESQNLL